jgi:hypothetical protein
VTGADSSNKDGGMDSAWHGLIADGRSEIFRLQILICPRRRKLKNFRSIQSYLFFATSQMIEKHFYN